MKTKVFPSSPSNPGDWVLPTFFECGQCGHWHSTGLAWNVDCRDDAHRFTLEDLDAHYGVAGWNEVPLEDEIEGEDE